MTPTLLVEEGESGLDLFERHEPRPSVGPPPQCESCGQFVNVKTAKPLPEYGDYGTLLSCEFMCARCANA